MIAIDPNQLLSHPCLSPLYTGSLLPGTVVIWLEETHKNCCGLHINGCVSLCGWVACLKQSFSFWKCLWLTGGDHELIVTFSSEQRAELDKGWDLGGMWVWVLPQHYPSTRHWTNCTASHHLTCRWELHNTHRFCRGSEEDMHADFDIKDKLRISIVFYMVWEFDSDVR